jgi:hypothetical protein
MIARGLHRRPSSRSLLAIALLVAAVAAGRAAARDAGEKAPPGDPAAWVDERVERWRPRPEERRLDEIGWAKDIREALRLSRESRRPVFLFTHDGRMGIGRC